MGPTTPLATKNNPDFNPFSLIDDTLNQVKENQAQLQEIREILLDIATKVDKLVRGPGAVPHGTVPQQYGGSPAEVYCPWPMAQQPLPPMGLQPRSNSNCWAGQN